MRNAGINIVVGVVVLLSFCLTGCQQTHPDGFPKVYPCEVTVLQEGVPLSDAHVTLIFQGSEKSWVVAGATNAQGIATMFTHGSYEGAPAGKYKVIISKVFMDRAPTPEQRQNPSFLGGMGIPFDLINPMYKNQNTTPLEIDVKPEKNAQTFDVGKEIKTQIKRV